MKNRWRILRFGLEFRDLRKSGRAIAAMAALQNFLLRNGDNDDVSSTSNGQPMDNQWTSNGHPMGHPMEHPMDIQWTSVQVNSEVFIFLFLF